MHTLIYSFHSLHSCTKEPICLAKEYHLISRYTTWHCICLIWRDDTAHFFFSVVVKTIRQFAMISIFAMKRRLIRIQSGSFHSWLHVKIDSKTHIWMICKICNDFLPPNHRVWINFKCINKKPNTFTFEFIYLFSFHRM